MAQTSAARLTGFFFTQGVSVFALANTQASPQTGNPECRAVFVADRNAEYSISRLCRSIRTFPPMVVRRPVPRADVSSRWSICVGF